MPARLLENLRSTTRCTSAIPPSLENPMRSLLLLFRTTLGPTARRPRCRFGHPYRRPEPRVTPNLRSQLQVNKEQRRVASSLQKQVVPYVAASFHRVAANSGT